MATLDFLIVAIYFLLALMLIGLDKAGGWDAVVAKTPPEFWSMFKPMSDPDFPVDRHRLRRADFGNLVLVHGSIHRAARV